MSGKNLFLVCLGLFLGALVLVPVNAVSNNESERGSVNSSYTSEKEVSPDTAEVSIAVKTEDSHSLSTAIAKNKEISDKVYSYLKGVINTSNGDYLKTSNFSASPEYIYSNGKRTFEKYQVSNNIIVHTKDISKISDMIDKSLAMGATNVDSLNFSLSDKDEVCSNLLKEATAKAKSRAELVANAAGSSITGIRNLSTSCSENRSYARPMFYANKMATMDAAEAAGSAPNIEAGVIKVYATVNADFFLK